MAILEADPEYRRRVLWLYLACVLIGCGLLLWGLPLLQTQRERYVKARGPAEALRLLQVLVALLFVPGLPMASYLYRFARRIQDSGQFPPPGAKVLRDTHIVEGAAARQRGSRLVVASIVLAVLSVVGMVCLPYLVGKIGDGAGRKPASGTRSGRPAIPAVAPTRQASLGSARGPGPMAP
jgi:hypothetical protein